MAIHFLPRSRVRLADFEAQPARFYLFPGVLICFPGDVLNIENYGVFRVLGVTWGGDNNDEATVAAERLSS